MDQHLAVLSPAEVKAMVKASRRRQSLAGGAGALLLHLVVGFILTVLVLTSVRETPPTLVITGSPQEQTPVLPKRTINHLSNWQRPSASSSAAEVIAASALPTVAIPHIEHPAHDALLGIDLGEGAGFGAGLGLGGAGAGSGMTAFFGNKSDGKHIAFAVDVSDSMSSRQLQLMKTELTRALEGLPPGTKYQVIFFSGPVWFAGQKISRSGRDRAVVFGHRGKKLVWVSEDGRADRFVYADGKQPLPTEPWRTASPSNIRQTTREVTKVKKSFGTSWQQPLGMALSMNPKPDVIYFMTDGNVRDAATEVKEVSRMNRRGKKRAKIFTTAMMEPRAAKQLLELARKNGGSFSKVLEDGSVVTVGDARP